jgi:polysaccharide transporter, PST family
LQGLNYLIPAAMLPYLVRVLGVEQYGLIAFAQAIAQYFIIATDYGFNFSATREIARNRDNQEEVSRVFWTVLAIKAVLLVLGAAVLGAAVYFVPRLHANANVYSAAYVAVIGNAIFPLWLFQGLERMRSISIITGLAKLASAVLVVLFVHSRQDTVLATLLLSCGFLIAGILGLIFAFRNHIPHFVRPRRADVQASIRDGRHLFLTTAAVSLYSNTNTFLVGALAGNEQAGYFSLADKLIRAVGGAIAPVIQASYPHTIRLMAQSRQAALGFIRKVMLRGAGIALLLGLGIFIFAKPFAAVAFRHDAFAVVSLVRWLSIFPLLAALSYVLGVLVLIPFGFDKVQSKLLLAIGITNVALGALLIPRYGALGGVISMNVVETLQVTGSSLILFFGGVKIFGRPSAQEHVPD